MTYHLCKILKQRPLSISQLKRNPFKKTPTSGGAAVTNAFRHLTDTVIGFDSQETPDMDVDLVPSFSKAFETVKENQNTENHTNENSSPKIMVSLTFFHIKILISIEHLRLLEFYDTNNFVSLFCFIFYAGAAASTNVVILKRHRNQHL